MIKIELIIDCKDANHTHAEAVGKAAAKFLNGRLIKMSYENLAESLQETLKEDPSVKSVLHKALMKDLRDAGMPPAFMEMCDKVGRDLLDSMEKGE